MPRVYNKHSENIPDDAVYIESPSKWANPYVYGSREECIYLYRAYIMRNPRRLDFSELRGKDLVCICAPYACHGDILLELAQEKNREGV